MMDSFHGTLKGNNVRKIYKKINYSLDNLEDRKNVVEEICESGFFEEYFDNHYKVNKNKNDNLSEDNNVCRLLENMGTYLLNSRDIIDDDKVYTQNELIKKMNKEEKIESITNGYFNPEVILDNLKSNEIATIVKDKSFRIANLNDDDFKYYYNLLDKYEQTVIDSYINLYNSIDNTRMNKIKKDKMKFGIKQDIESILFSLKHNQHNNTILKGGVKYNNMITKDNIHHRHILAGLSYQVRKNKIAREEGLLFKNLENDNLIKEEIDRLVNISNLTELEKEILKSIRLGLTTREISSIMNISLGLVSKCKSNIVNKVLKTIEEEK